VLGGIQMEALLGVILGAVYVAVVLIPVARILDRTGYNRWAAFIAIVPVVNILGLWAFAFGEWPSEIAKPREQEKWSAGDNETFKKALANKNWS
jgi:predicted PurR-regulated permease PerM